MKFFMRPSYYLLNHLTQTIHIMRIIGRKQFSTFLLPAIFLFAVPLKASEYSFLLKNSLGTDRSDELVELELDSDADFSSLALFDSEGNNVAFQWEGNKIMFQANIKAGSVSTYTLKEGTPLTPETKTYAVQKMPSSRNDIAWENDLSIFRMYSSKLLSSEPNTANGVDIWYKKKSYPVIDKMYSYSNYHVEGEEGVDAHSVNGKTLGGGGVAVYHNNKLWLHDPYDECEFIENTPLRSEFVLTYNNVDVDGDKYKKTLRITTSANSLLNKAVVKYEGPAKKMQIAPAIYLHTNMGYNTNGVTYESEKNIIGLAEDKSEGTVTSPNARMYAGIYMPGETSVSTIDHHLVLLKDYEVGTEVTYYFGGGWNIFPEGKYLSDDDWFYELNKFKECITHPIVETSAENLPKKSDVTDVMMKANDYWQSANPVHGNAFWNRAAYHTGNMEAYNVTGEQSYLDYSEAWSEQNVWKGAKSDNKANWKYSYGESDDYVLFGDWQICFQVYIDLFNIDPADHKIARAIEVMEYQMSTPQSDYWWWADGLYMVMPVMTKLHKITGNPLYLEKLHEYWQYANSIMYDEEEGIYFRDAKYVYPAHTTTNGKKDFWARGNGWVFAAFARILEDLPHDDKYRDTYISYYKRMAERLAEAQMPEGYWSRSLIDPDYASGYETSGTAFFTYGYLWGINNGYLSEKVYGSTVEKAWKYLTETALQPSGKVGYVQPIGENAAQHNVSAETTADFGVGAFLLAAAEMSKYAVGEMPKQVVRLYTAGVDDRTVITAVFSKTLESSTALTAENYLINGKQPKGNISFDGERTVTIILDSPLDYGRHTISVSGLIGAEDELLEENCSKTLIITVPSYPIDSSVKVTAIGNQSGNPAANAIDNNYDTRWSQEGMKQWIQLDLGKEYDVWGADIAFYSGNSRKTYFEIEISSDNVTFEKVVSDMESSGTTNEMERYSFPSVKARYVRIVCSGNSANNWNSITELRTCYSDEDAFANICLPSFITSDILMPAGVTWTSSDHSLLTASGYVTLPYETTNVTMTAAMGELTKDFDVTVLSRDPEKNNVVMHYTFDESDLYTADNNAKYVKDRSGKDNDARVYGKAVIDGTLNLTSNTNAGFSTNGYLLAPQGLLDSLRSFTVLVTVNPERIANLPRIYDFGSGSGNSVFARLESPSMGFKYNGGSTRLINSPVAVNAGEATRLAFTFDAKTKTSVIYIDCEAVVSSTLIDNEPYQLSRIAADTRNYIGRTQWWDSNVASSNVDYCGTMDDFYLFDVALNNAEIRDIQYRENDITSLDTNNLTDNKFYLQNNIVNKGEEVILVVRDEVSYQTEIFDTNGALIRRVASSAKMLSLGSFSQPGIFFITVADNNNSRQTLKFIVR